MLTTTTSLRDRLESLVRMTCVPDGDDQIPGAWGLWFDLWSQAFRHPLVAKDRLELERRWRSTIEGVVRDGITAGEIDDVDAEDFAVTWAVLLDGLSIQVALDDPIVDSERAVDIAMTFAERELGLGPPKVPARRPRSRREPGATLDAAAFGELRFIGRRNARLRIRGSSRTALVEIRTHTSRSSCSHSGSSPWTLGISAMTRQLPTRTSTCVWAPRNTRCSTVAEKTLASRSIGRPPAGDLDSLRPDGHADVLSRRDHGRRAGFDLEIADAAPCAAGMDLDHLGVVEVGAAEEARDVRRRWL